MNSKKKTPRRIKRKRLENAMLNRVIKRLLFVAVAIIMLLPAIDPGFSLKNLNFLTTKAGDDNPSTQSTLIPTSTIKEGVWHSNGASYDLSLNTVDLYSGSGPVDFTFHENTSDEALNLEKQTIFPLADDGATEEINDNKDIEINFEWKFEKKEILGNDWQKQQKDVATLTICYKNKTSNVGLLSSPLFDFANKTGNSTFTTSHYPLTKSVVSSVNFTALAQLFDTGNQNGNALFFKYGDYVSAGNQEFDSSKSAVAGSQAADFFAKYNPHTFSWNDNVKNYLQLIPTKSESAKYQMSFELNSTNIPSFKTPFIFQRIQLSNNSGDNYKFGSDYKSDIRNLYQHFAAASKSFPTNKSYDIFAIKPGSTFVNVNKYLTENLGWGKGLPTLHKGSMFDDEEESGPISIEIIPFANLPVNSSIDASATILPESASDLPITWSAWSVVNGHYIRADDPKSPDNQYVIIDGAKITAKKTGDIVIRAQVIFGAKSLEAEEPLKIIDPDIPVNITVGELPDLEIGSSFTASKILIPTTAKGVTTWSSSSSEIANINATTGVITGVAEGSAKISATHTYTPQLGVSDITLVDTKEIKIIKPIVKVDYVNITPSENFELYLPNDANANVSNTWKNLQATVTPSNAENKNIIWSTSNPDIAQVTQDGRVISVSSGTAIITATAEDTSQGVKSASIEVAVRDFSVIPPTKIVVKGNETTESGNPAFQQKIPKRLTHKVEYQIYPENVTQKDVIFSIVQQSRNDVIEISDDGIITAKNVGSAIIQVTSGVKSNVYGRLRIIVTGNSNIQEVEGTYLTNPADVTSRSSLNARLIANVGGTNYFPIVDSKKYEQIQAKAINIDPSLNKNIRVTTGSKIDAATKKNNGNWDEYVGINERFQGDYEPSLGANATYAERASGIYAETLSSGVEKKISDIQGTALSGVEIDKTSEHNRAAFINSPVYQISNGQYYNPNQSLAQTGAIIYYTQNFAPNGHLGDAGLYSSLQRGDNPNGDAPSSDTGGLKNGQGMYAVNFRQAVYMKYGDYANKQYSSCASVIFPPLNKTQLQTSDSSPKTLKFGNSQTESIRVEYEKVGTFVDFYGNRRAMSAVMIISNIVYGTGGGSSQWVGAAGEYRPSISFSNNLYSGFFYQNIKAFTVNFEFYAADEENNPTYEDHGKLLNFAKELKFDDFDHTNNIIKQDVSDDVISGSILTFSSLNRSDTNGGNSQTEFAGAIATSEDLADSLNLINGKYFEENFALGTLLQLLRIGLMSKKTSIGLNGNAPGHSGDANKDEVFKKLAQGTYYAGGYTDGTNHSSEYYFYDILGQSTYPRGGVSFPIWGVEHMFLIGSSKGHTYNSISSRSLRVAKQDVPNKTVTTTVNDQLQNAPANYYSGNTSFAMRYDNDLDRFWELEAALSSPFLFMNKYINGSDPLNRDYYNYYGDIPTIEKELGLTNPNFIGAVLPVGLDDSLETLKNQYRKYRMLDNQVPILKYWQKHGKTGARILTAEGIEFLPIKNMRFVGKSGVVNTNYNSSHEHTGNEFTYYINQPMIDLLKTEIAPTTIEMFDELPEGIEVNGDIKVYDNLGQLIARFTKTNVVTTSANGREKIHVTLKDDANSGNYSEATDHLTHLIRSFIAQIKQYGDILKAGFSDEFTYEIPVRIKENYRSTYQNYNNAAMITFTYGDVGENPRSLVTNAVQVATRGGSAAFAFNKQVLTDKKTGASNTITEGVTFKLYDGGVSSTFPSSDNLAEYITNSNKHPIYGSNGYFEIVLVESDLIQAKATDLSKIQWLVLKEETTHVAYDNQTLKKFEFGVYVDYVNQKEKEFVFVRKNKMELARVKID
ncbi:MAG: Ig-like domain-containing protein [Streptococcaceae bacterium]|jgi:uncharacterized protein YjdB|nr:Ig-like domain-containing protein [Streptococcaceae bacterium]